ncbi:hypothetical protein BKA83DRAFT_4127195 [Pisolithus microcarpus]|nr:hypothetical protein BKA83DRAFT_4127195 [Pisolithus microcarpus]
MSANTTSTNNTMGQGHYHFNTNKGGDNNKEMDMDILPEDHRHNFLSFPHGQLPEKDCSPLLLGNAKQPTTPAATEPSHQPCGSSLLLVMVIQSIPGVVSVPPLELCFLDAIKKGEPERRHRLFHDVVPNIKVTEPTRADGLTLLVDKAIAEVMLGYALMTVIHDEADQRCDLGRTGKSHKMNDHQQYPFDMAIGRSTKELDKNGSWLVQFVNNASTPLPSSSQITSLVSLIMDDCHEGIAQHDLCNCLVHQECEPICPGGLSNLDVGHLGCSPYQEISDWSPTFFMADVAHMQHTSVTLAFPYPLSGAFNACHKLIITPFHVHSPSKKHNSNGGTDTTPGIDWMTITNNKLEPLPTNTVKVKFTKVDEKAQWQQEWLVAWHCQEEEENLQKVVWTAFLVVIVITPLQSFSGSYSTSKNDQNCKKKNLWTPAS